MSKILKIDNFAKSNKSKYGLESGGTCYLVKSPFYLEVISSYEIESLGKPNKLKEVWSKVKVAPEDIISVTDSGCFLQLKDITGFVECRPEIFSKKGEPDFDTFPKESLTRIGMDMIDSNPMTFEERKKLIITRI